MSSRQPERHPPAPDVPIPDKLYFKIGEVAELVGVQPHVLRYWEKEIPAIRPSKSTTNQRRYRRKDVEFFREIRRLLYEERYTLAGARKRLASGVRDDAGREVTAATGAPAGSDAARFAEPQGAPAEQLKAELQAQLQAQLDEQLQAQRLELERLAQAEEHAAHRLARAKQGLRELIRLAGETP